MVWHRLVENKVFQEFQPSRMRTVQFRPADSASKLENQIGVGW